MKIALAFSGGGYRASAFSLGTLSYLDRVNIANDTSLLSSVIALSTVSGGTITGARYAIGIKQGETFKEIYHSLYEFFINVDLISLGLERLSSSENWNKPRIRSIICAMADTYDSQLFKSSKFGILLNEEKPIHLKHISFNATEFTTGVQFRFQISENKSATTDEPIKAIIGNHNNRIPDQIGHDIRMGDILAASSCFPGGFEPINFPTDFVLPDTEDLTKLKSEDKYPIGLMDGGIVDNQGIKSVLLAEDRLEQNETSNKGKIIDLVILNDVSSPYMEEFKASVLQNENWWRKLTLHKIKRTNNLVFVASLFGLVCSFSFGSVLLSIISTFIFTISSILLISFGLINKKIKKVDLLNNDRLKILSSIKLVIFEGLLSNRIKSVLKLTGSVFLKSIRRLNYDNFYADESWKNRRIMNAIYELNEGVYTTTNPIKEDLKPSMKIQEVSKMASSMATTLWFLKKDLDNNMLNSIIACGQFNICWNLLEYIEIIKLDPTNTNENHKALISCEEQLRRDWEMFKLDPFWLVNELNNKK